MAKTYEARVEVDAEVIGVFRDMIPERAFGPDGELATPRQRNECTPDLQLGFQVSLDPRPADYHPCPGRHSAFARTARFPTGLHQVHQPGALSLQGKL